MQREQAAIGMPVQRAVAGIDAVAPFHQRLDALLQDAQEAVGAAARPRPALRVRVARRTAGRVRARGRRRVVVGTRRHIEALGILIADTHHHRLQRLPRRQGGRRPRQAFKHRVAIQHVDHRVTGRRRLPARRCPDRHAVLGPAVWGGQHVPLYLLRRYTDRQFWRLRRQGPGVPGLRPATLINLPIAIQTGRTGAVVHRHALVGQVHHRQAERDVLVQLVAAAQIERGGPGAAARRRRHVAVVRPVLLALHVRRRVQRQGIRRPPVRTQVQHVARRAVQRLPLQRGAVIGHFVVGFALGLRVGVVAGQRHRARQRQGQAGLDAAQRGAPDIAPFIGRTRRARAPA
ncbi:hypothetical protein G6F31_014907 [Rhizopus arrhizus]|nr:hypothetical protein G6F31_014907 [Rhizopus arrhizus]